MDSTFCIAVVADGWWGKFDIAAITAYSGFEFVWGIVMEDGFTLMS